MAERAAGGMERFWDATRGWCADVLDGPSGDDWSLRPNQLFTVSLSATAFDVTRARSIVDVCAARLWTPMGLRTLASDDPAYVGTYAGTQSARDGAYHQGTVWPWLTGPFARAHLRAYGDRERTRAFVAPLIDALELDALGTLCEIASGDPPYTPAGCPAQAWSVGELIAVLRLLER